MTKPKAIICDLDGTLCNHDHRLHLVDQNHSRNIPVVDGQAIRLNKDGKVTSIKEPNLSWKKNWGAFFDLMGKDTQNEWCVDLLERAATETHSDLAMQIIFLTGRPEKYREVTEKWLRGNHFGLCKLYMKPDSKCVGDPSGNWISGPEFKKFTYQDLIKPHYNVLYALDDDELCAKMWREQGVVCLQCK